ncbi:MAG: hypothetical protein WD810_03375 [Solirubrobacterales bacterium]
MRASFPVEFLAVLLGKSREAGSFNTPEGEVKFDVAFELAFESSEGLTQTCRVSRKALDEAADFEVEKQPAYTSVLLIGDVNVRDDGGYLRPTTVRLAKPATAAKAA